MKSDALTPSRKLHPVSAVFFIMKTLKDMLYPLVGVVITTVSRGELNPLWFGLGIPLFILLTVAIGFIAWSRYRYEARDKLLVVQSGIFIRKNTSIPRERIQSLDESAGVFHRMFGVVRLQVETAGGKKPEAVLHAVRKEEADRIRSMLLSAGVGDTEPVSEPAAVADQERTPGDSTRLSFGRLLLYSMISGRALVAFAVIGAAYSQFDDVLSKYFDIYDIAASLWGRGNVAVLVVLILVVGWMVGILLTVMKFHGFTLRRSDNKLHIQHGLLERKQVTVSLKRIQAVQIKQNALQRIIGCFSIHIVSAGYGGKEGQSALLFPFLRAEEIPGFLETFTPGYRLPLRLNALPGPAFASYMAVPVALAFAAAIPCVIWIPGGYGWFAGLLPVVAVAWSWLRYCYTGWALDEDRMVIRNGGFGITTSIVPRRRIQWYGTIVTPLQICKDLITFRAVLASGSHHLTVSLRHIGSGVGRELLGWVSSGKSKS